MDIKTDARKTSLKKRPLIFLDLETTGLEVQKHEILEIGALKVEQKKPFKVLEEFSLKVLPQHLELADPQALKIMGYSDEGWKEAVSLQEALDKLDQFACCGILVGYNVSFDWAFLDKAYFSLGRQDPFYYHRLDVMPMSYLKLFSKRSLKRFSLGEIGRFLEIREENRHHALDDARMTYNVFRKIFEVK